MKRAIGRIKGDGGPLSGTIYDFDDFREAAEFSMSRKALSKDMYEVVIPPFNNSPAMKLKAQLCYEKAGGKMSWRFHSSPGIPVDKLPRPHSVDIDRVRTWRAW